MPISQVPGAQTASYASFRSIAVGKVRAISHRADAPAAKVKVRCFSLSRFRFDHREVVPILSTTQITKLRGKILLRYFQNIDRLSCPYSTEELFDLDFEVVTFT